MRIRFRLVDDAGPAGDPHKLLVGQCIEEPLFRASTLVNMGELPFNWWRRWRLKAARQRIINELEILTGNTFIPE